MPPGRWWVVWARHIDGVAPVGDLDVVMWTDSVGELSYRHNLALGVLRRERR